MHDVVRLRNYRHYLPDGRGWVECRPDSKDEVVVAIVIGLEPKVINEPSDFLDVERIVLEMAENIKRAEAAEKAKERTNVTDP